MNRSNVNYGSMILAMVITIMFTASSLGADMGPRRYRDGYGTYDMMGQDPDELMKYGHDMMRYGFHERGMDGGTNKYPGYGNELSDDTIKKLNAEQEAFIHSTDDLRQTIYEKELYLKAELVKKSPDIETALKFQNSISEARGKYEQIMIKHIIRMKKINLEAKK